ncbi:homeobox protein 9-like [Zophobas morio]|uniref:homeobox protein 9-like n=1 Tax=Zophobas morio TaxID=2755281 RepID=UPI003083828E
MDDGSNFGPLNKIITDINNENNNSERLVKKDKCDKQKNNTENSFNNEFFQFENVDFSNLILPINELLPLGNDKNSLLTFLPNSNFNVNYTGVTGTSNLNVVENRIYNINSNTKNLETYVGTTTESTNEKPHLNKTKNLKNIKNYDNYKNYYSTEINTSKPPNYNQNNNLTYGGQTAVVTNQNQLTYLPPNVYQEKNGTFGYAYLGKEDRQPTMPIKEKLLYNEIYRLPESTMYKSASQIKQQNSYYNTATISKPFLSTHYNFSNGKPFLQEVNRNMAFLPSPILSYKTLIDLPSAFLDNEVNKKTFTENGAFYKGKCNDRATKKKTKVSNEKNKKAKINKKVIKKSHKGITKISEFHSSEELTIEELRKLTWSNIPKYRKYFQKFSEEENANYRRYYNPKYCHNASSSETFDKQLFNSNVNFKKKQNILNKWLITHADNPYPCAKEKIILAQLTSSTVNQITHWFVNSRRRKRDLLEAIRKKK